ncbi:CHAT domain-containing protein [Candidatus Halobeggiatoa sp. HSG11]|nr:CHAT domain-containing protein [Candidatus Halobeggiatoa sp. HSG11]
MKIFLGLLLSSVFFNTVNADENLFQKGNDFYQQRNFAQAIEVWETALQTETVSQFDILLRLGTSYQALGNYNSALNAIKQAISVAQTPEQETLAHVYLGDILLTLQQPDDSFEELEKYLPKARTLDNKLILANLLNNMSNALSSEQYYFEALSMYQEVLEIAEHSSDVLLQIQALNNQAQVYFEVNEPENSITILEKELTLLAKLPNNHVKSFHLLSLGQLVFKLQTKATSPKLNAYNIFTEALNIAYQLQDNRSISYAKSFLGQLYAQKHEYPAALKLTKEAIFFAQELPDLLYLWEWQQGNILHSQENLEESLVAYQKAFDYLAPIRTSLTNGQRNSSEVFYERVRPIYYSLADVLLQKAKQLPDSSEQKKLLLTKARDTVEHLKEAELQNYFQDECVSAAKTQITELKNIDKNTAVLYPILLPNRVELLLTTSDDMHQIVVPVDNKQIKQVILDFSKNLQRVTEGRFIKQSKQLYDWMIRPIEEHIAKYDIKTLIVVPDGPLRTIPFAALYNDSEKKFLFDYVALAVTPSLTLTDPRPLPRKNTKVLLNGLSKSVQDFSALPSVIKEIGDVDKLFDNSTTLIDENFLLQTVTTTLENSPYDIVHISSHGQFDRNPKYSFLLTYDDKLTMDRLEKLFRLNDLRKKQVELLTLSACQTAVGDERAALGLAGVAIKAGARSALASLWFVDDNATSQLITDFYKQLQNPNLSKAQALQNAQRNLASKRKYRHPAYWSPFLLIGNWL